MQFCKDVSISRPALEYTFIMTRNVAGLLNIFEISCIEFELVIEKPVESRNERTNIPQWLARQGCPDTLNFLPVQIVVHLCVRKIVLFHKTYHRFPVTWFFNWIFWIFVFGSLVVTAKLQSFTGPSLFQFQRGLPDLDTSRPFFLNFRANFPFKPWEVSDLRNRTDDSD